MSLTAQQYIGMRALFRGALAANSLLVANPSDGEVLGFFNQLLTEATGAATLPSAQNLAVGYAFRGLLSGNFQGVSNPSDADVVSFWAQLATDSSGAAALVVLRYQALKSTLRDVLSLNYPGANNPSLQDLLGFFSVFAGFNGNFGALLPGNVLSLRSDLGLGLTSTTANTWADQSAGAHNVTEGSAGVGIASATGALNGRTTLIANGTTHYGTYSGLGFVAPATTNFYWYIIARFLTSLPAGNQYLTAASDFSTSILQLAGQNNLEAFNGATQAQAAAVGQWARILVIHTGSVNDVWWWGATHTGTGVSFGNQAPQSARGVFADNAGAAKGNWEAAYIGAGIAPQATVLSTVPTIDAGANSFYGGLVQL